MIIEIQINNWEKYNPKRDQKTYTWLRLDNGIFVDPLIWDMSSDEKVVFIQLLCEASKKNCGVATINVKQMCHNLQISEQKINQAFDLFEEKGLTTAHDRKRPNTTPTNVRTNERNRPRDRAETDSVKKWSPTTEQLMECYALYPRKDKRAEFLTRAKKKFRKPEDLENFKKAVENYKAHLVSEDIEPRFTKQVTTFLTNWEEWLEKGTGETKLKVVPKDEKWDILA